MAVARGERPFTTLTEIEQSTMGITLPMPIPVSLPNSSAQPTPSPEHTLPSGIVTFLFTDIQGSTPLWERDPDGMRLSLRQHHAILYEAIITNGGQVFKTVGDAFQAVFVEPSAAAMAAVAGQRGLATATWGSTGPLAVRMGLHMGSARAKNNDYPAEHTLNRVARIMSAGHGGQILLSSEVATMIRQELPPQIILTDLGQHRLKGMQELEHIYQLVASDLPSEFPPLQSLSPNPSNLPLQTTPFIGRTQELAELSALMSGENGRLITIVGPGGMGKTRLSLALAEQFVASTFPHGIYFVNLAPLSGVEQIIPTLAESLHFPVQGKERDGRPPKQQLLDYLREKRMLLIMDNFESVLAGAELVADILQTAPDVQIIVTSRERLHLRQEQVYPIQGLEFPDWDTVLPDGENENAVAYTAVQLFLQSAQRNQPDFQLTGSHDLTHLARICRLVAGMPLAIELAAAWVDILSLAEIAEEIQTSLDFLETEMRDMPDRHRSIRAAITTSWQKLTADEQSVFAQLSVFRGGFTRRAGQTITTASLRVMSRLVAKSFLQYDQGRERYQIHELMRQYGAEKLALDQQLEMTVRQEHSRYYCQALAERTPDLQGQRQKDAIAEIELDIENARAAWNWAAHNREAALLDQALFSLFRFFEWNGRYQDYERSANEAVDSLKQSQTPPIQQVVLVKLLHRKFTQTKSIMEKKSLLAQTHSLLDQLIQSENEVSDLQAADELYRGQLQTEDGAYPQAEHSLRSSLTYYQQSGDQWHEVNVWSALSRWAANKGSYQEAEAYGQQGLTLARKLGDRWQMILAFHDLGFSFNNQGHFGKMRRQMEEALKIARELGHIPTQGLMLMEIGTAYMQEGQPTEAIRYHQKGLAILRQVGDRQRVAWTMHMLAWDYLALADMATAAYWLQEAEELTRNLQNVRTLAFYLVVCSWFALVQGRYDEALLHAEEAAAAVKGSGGGVDVLANVLTTLGWVQLVHQQWRQAEKSLYEALMTKNVFTRDALLPIGYLLARRQPTTESVTRAWQLIGLSDQASLFIKWSIFAAFAERFQPPELFMLSSEEVEMAKVYGRSLNPDSAFANLLEELPNLGWAT